MNYPLLLTVLSIVPHDAALRDVCDVIEVNHFYDTEGRLVFDQAIFWDWDGTRHQVRAWRLIKQPNQLPRRDWTNGGYVATWMDGETLRTVRSDAVRETWEQYDVELAERAVLDKEKRRELRSGK